MDEYARQLFASHDIRVPLIRAAIGALALPAGSHGLDVGCGVGLVLPALLDAVAPGGRVTGLDVSAELLEHARRFVHERGVADRATVVEGDAHALPFDDDHFDWAWSMDCVGYAPLDPVPALRELARVVQPGGRVALALWSHQQLLAGYPRLEARLDAADGGIASMVQRARPEHHYLRALGWFQQLGLAGPRAVTFTDTVQPPFDAGTRRCLAVFYDMLWGEAREQLAADERAQLGRLVDPDSPEFIADAPGYCALFGYTLFFAAVPGG